MPQLSPPDRLAEHMAGGCPSLIEAARLMRITEADARRHWQAVCRGLGRQAA